MGYETLHNSWLKSFNGCKIKNLKHLKTLIDGCFSQNDNKNKNSIIENSNINDRNEGSTVSSNDSPNNDVLMFEFSTGMQVVIDCQSAMNSEEQICREHFIPSSCSLDLL